MSEDQDAAMSEWPVLLFNDIAMSGPVLQLRAMSVTAALLQPGSVLIPVLLLPGLNRQSKALVVSGDHMTVRTILT